MGKHTPGPWVSEVIDGDLVVSQPGIDGQVIMVLRNMPLDAEWKANATLVAAAPDLLEACRECAEGLERDVRLGADPLHPVSLTTLRNRATSLRAAIAQAGGGETRAVTLGTYECSQCRKQQPLGKIHACKP